MTLNRTNLFSKDISSKMLNTDLNLQFERGWSPVLAPVQDGSRVVFQLMDWIGGDGTKPNDPTTTSIYLGPRGFTTTIGDAVDIFKFLSVPVPTHVTVLNDAWRGNIYYTKDMYGFAHVWGNVIRNASTAYTYQMPAGYKPAMLTPVTCASSTGTTVTDCYVRNTTGEIWINTAITSGYFNVIYKTL